MSKTLLFTWVELLKENYSISLKKKMIKEKKKLIIVIEFQFLIKMIWIKWYFCWSNFNPVGLFFSATFYNAHKFLIQDVNMHEFAVFNWLHHNNNLILIVVVVGPSHHRLKLKVLVQNLTTQLVERNLGKESRFI